MNFKFNLGQPVTIVCSGETGEVIGRAEYLSGEPTYQVRYKSADGRGVEAWWGESALTRCEQCERSDSAERNRVTVSIIRTDQVSEAIKDLVHRTIVESKDNAV